MTRAYSARVYIVTYGHHSVSQSAWAFIFRNSVARVTSKRWLTLARGMAHVIKICKIFKNSVARVTSKRYSRWLAEWLALSKYVKSLEIRCLAL